MAANRITIAEWRKLARRKLAKGKWKAAKPRAKKPPPQITWRVIPCPGCVVVRIDGLKLISEGNRRGHWSVTHKRNKVQQEIVGAALLGVNLWHWVERPLRITVTRRGPKRLDTDNCVSSAKGCIDAVAASLGIDDGSPEIEWRVEQEPIGVRVYGVEIVIESKERKAV